MAVSSCRFFVPQSAALFFYFHYFRALDRLIQQTVITSASFSSECRWSAGSVLSPGAWPQKWYSSLHRAEPMFHMFRSSGKYPRFSCLSKPISGRNTGSVHTSLVQARLWTVWLATCPMLSPVIRASEPSSSASFPQFSSYTAHDNSQLIMGAFFIDCQLNVCKIHDV